MLRIKILLGAIIALTAWIHPAYAISAFAEQPQDNPTFINYEKIRQENTKPVEDETPAPSSRKVAAPKRADTKPQAQKADGQRDYGKGEIQDLIRKYSAEYGIDAQTPLCIAKNESGFNPNSKNKSSSASGVFQYLNSTWEQTDEGKAGLSVFDAEANIKAAVKYMAIHKKTTPWVVAGGCPKLQKIN